MTHKSRGQTNTCLPGIYNPLVLIGDRQAIVSFRTSFLRRPIKNLVPSISGLLNVIEADEGISKEIEGRKFVSESSSVISFSFLFRRDTQPVVA